ncbi:MAG: hypothetical protein QXP27_09960 [Candidatus Methanomethyliaceae archaeon]
MRKALLVLGLGLLIVLMVAGCGPAGSATSETTKVEATPTPIPIPPSPTPSPTPTPTSAPTPTPTIEVRRSDFFEKVLYPFVMKAKGNVERREGKEPPAEAITRTLKLITELNSNGIFDHLIITSAGNLNTGDLNRQVAVELLKQAASFLKSVSLGDLKDTYGVRGTFDEQFFDRHFSRACQFTNNALTQAANYRDNRFIGEVLVSARRLSQIATTSGREPRVPTIGMTVVDYQGVREAALLLSLVFYALVE